MLSFAVKAQTFQPTFQHYGVDEGMPSTEVYNIVQDDRGYLWFATDRGISRFDGYSFKNYTLENGLPELAVYRVYKDYRDRIWGLNASGALFYIEHDDVVLYPHNEKLQELTNKGTIPSAMYVDSSAHLHLGYMEMGYIHLDQNGQQIDESVEDTTVLINHFTNLGNVAFCYRTGSLESKARNSWIHFEDSVKVLEGLSNTGIRITLQGKNSYFLATNEVLWIDESQEFKRHTFDQHTIGLSKTDGYIWTGHLNGGVQGFHEAEFPTNGVTLLEGKSVSSVFRDHEGGYWFTTLNEGIYYTPSLQVQHVDFGSTKMSYRVEALTWDGEDRMFVGLTYGEVLAYQRGKWEQLKSENESGYFKSIRELNYLGNRRELYISELDGTHIYKEGSITREVSKKGFLGIIEHPEKNELVAIHPFGLMITSEGQFDSIQKTTDRCRALHLDQQQQLWIGGFAGVGRLNGDSIEDWSHQNELLKVRTEDFASSEDRLYIATIGEGLVVMEGDSIWQISSKDGLLSDIVNSLLLDGEQLWVGTSLGLNKIVFEQDGYQITSITTSDGLISNEITQLELLNDTLWIGTREGLSVMPVTHFECASARPYIRLGQVLVNGEPQGKTNAYELTNEQKELEFIFTGISFKSPGKVPFRLKLEGADADWVYTNNTQVRYTGLAHGSYKFHLEALNDQGEWVRSFDAISFTIAAAWWQQLWFWMVINLLVLTFVVILLRARTSRIRNKELVEKRLREYQQQALSAQMNPHFMFNSLNAIQDVLLHKSKVEASGYLTRFARLMRRVLDNSAESKITLSKELEALELYMELEQLRFEDQFEFDLKVEEGIDTATTKIPTLLIQPFVENAIWHGLRLRKEKGGQLQIRLYREAGALFCEITDNGVGREEAQKATRSHASKGSSITSKRLELLMGDANHHEIIDLYDQEGNPEGTRVVLKLPTG